ncbi:3'-5' exonuclease [Bacillus phage AR9]|uniref:3'-5' exonuclease n=2 Tax=Bacillus phage PBS1 TaxID=10683 RepID=A0A172JI65_BPPB1|nr:exonuclease [Bacillus phage AR9]YP_009664248.1 exonuclease [Bacillus phage PBS1]AMS01242.1 3'-5' exonuclease [Bacillus phage AR9]AST99868.1 hypothetical protein PBI_PBS1_46 [Bacillus phage PBS1]BDE75312.1 hypothetical protein [Bacillus phage PBS1]
MQSKNEISLGLSVKITNKNKNAKIISLCISDLGGKNLFYAEFNDYSEHFLDYYAKNDIIPNLLFNEKNDFIIESNNHFHIKSNSDIIRKEVSKWLANYYLKHKKKIKFIIDDKQFSWLFFSELIDYEIFPKFMLSNDTIDLDSLLEFLNINLSGTSLEKKSNAIISAKGNISIWKQLFDVYQNKR